MTSYLGDFPVNSTVYVPFQTFDSNGASITITGLAVTDIEIYKDGSATQRASDAGYTLLDTDGIDFDGITGIHGFSIDLSNNTDAGFYAAGHEYWIVVSAITCDTRTINFVAATFSIERAGGALALLKSATYGLSALKDILDTSGVVLGATQGAITWAQQKIVANVVSQGALDIRNSNAGGYGQFNSGGETGLFNYASAAGSKGQVNQGVAIGQYNYGDIGAENQGIATFGLENNGVSEGQYNTASAAGSIGLRNQGVATGNSNVATGVGSTGQMNQGLSEGQYNNATAAGGIGQRDVGITYGVQATGGTDGINAVGTTNVGLLANGAIAGQYNLGNGGAGYGQYNSGDIIGQYNAATVAGSAGQANQGVAQGQHNSGATGLQNDGGAVGQYNTGTTYGLQNTGASGQVNVGTGGDGIYASGTDYGIQAVGVTGDIDPDLTSLLTGVNVTSIGNGVITAASIATDAIDADALATDAADEVADHVWDEAIAGHLGVGSTGAALNAAGGGATVFPAGAIEFTYTVTDSVTGLPLEGVEVWISTDNPAVNIVWKGDTDAFGIAMDVLGNKPKLDAGTYYFWRQLAGYLFTDPDTEVVS